MKITLVVLAAGMGTRYGGLKQMDPMGPGGEIVLDYSVYDALRAGFSKVVFVIREAIRADFETHILSHLRPHIDVGLALQDIADLPAGFRPPSTRSKPWGTAHAVWAARGEVDGPFAVINADDFYGRGAYVAMAEFLRQCRGDEQPLAGAMIGYRLENTLSEHGGVARGACRTDAAGLLLDVEEIKGIVRSADGCPEAPGTGGAVRKLPADTPVSMNFWGFVPSMFSHFETRFRQFLESNAASADGEFYLADPVSYMIARRLATFRVLPDAGRWFGVTYREDKAGVQHAIRALVDTGEYPQKLW